MKKVVISMLVMAMVFSFIPFYVPTAKAKNVHLLDFSEMQAIMGMGGGGGSTPPDEDEPSYETYWRKAGTGYRTDYGSVQLLVQQSYLGPGYLNFNETRTVTVTVGSSLKGGINALDLFNLGVSYNHTTITTKTTVIQKEIPSQYQLKVYAKEIIDVNWYKAEFVKDYGSRVEVVKTESAERKIFNGNFAQTTMLNPLNS